jgi:O-antigen/teichoic acid export membrane protein
MCPGRSNLPGTPFSNLLWVPYLGPDLSPDIRRTVDFGKWVLAQGIGGVLFGVVDRLLIGTLFGSADHGRFRICLQLAQFVHSIQAAACQILMPWVSEKVSIKRRAQYTIIQYLRLKKNNDVSPVKKIS